MVDKCPSIVADEDWKGQNVSLKLSNPSVRVTFTHCTLLFLVNVSKMVLLWSVGADVSSDGVRYRCWLSDMSRMSTCRTSKDQTVSMFDHVEGARLSCRSQRC